MGIFLLITDSTCLPLVLFAVHRGRVEDPGGLIDTEQPFNLQADFNHAKKQDSIAYI